MSARTPIIKVFVVVVRGDIILPLAGFPVVGDAAYPPGLDFLLKLLLIYFVRARAKYNKALSQTLLPNCHA